MISPYRDRRLLSSTVWRLDRILRHLLWWVLLPRTNHHSSTFCSFCLLYLYFEGEPGTCLGPYPMTRDIVGHLVDSCRIYVLRVVFKAYDYGYLLDMTIMDWLWELWYVCMFDVDIWKVLSPELPPRLSPIYPPLSLYVLHVTWIHVTPFSCDIPIAWVLFSHPLELCVDYLNTLPNRWCEFGYFEACLETLGFPFAMSLLDARSQSWQLHILLELLV